MLKEWWKFFQENPSFGPILVLASLGLLFFAPIHPQVCAGGSYQQSGPCARENLIFWLFNFVDEHSGIVSAIATVFIAWFTLTLKNASIEQGRLTERSVIIAERTLTEIERPYLFLIVEEINHSEFSSFVYSGEAANQQGIPLPTISFRFKNHGRTPAIVQAIRSGFYTSVGPPSLLDSIVRPHITTVIPAGGETIKITDFLSWPLTVIAVETIRREPQNALWFWGEVTYKGIASFDTPYITEFLWKYTDSVGNFGPSDEGGKRRNRNT